MDASDSVGSWEIHWKAVGRTRDGPYRPSARAVGSGRPRPTVGTLIYHISISDILGWRGPDGEGNFNAAARAQPQIAPH